MKSASEGSFYLPTDAPDEVLATPATAGPWSPTAQHGGPPSGLLTRALEGLLGPGRTLARISVDLLGPVPVGRLRVSAAVERPGRTVALLSATLHDVAAGRPCAVARAWAVPTSDDGPGKDVPLPHGPADGAPGDLPASWARGYVDHVTWSWVSGAVLSPGAATVWMRPTVPLLPDEPLTGLPMLMTCVDSASGVSAALDPAEWAFLNTELTVHLLREPVGDWVCVDAETTLGPAAAGIATATVHDERGLVARTTQSLLVTPRRT
jgi:acyl-coenzyme A thioesterase PaaI-like protein